MRTTSMMALVMVALGAGPALADIPPPATYVETCTLAKQQTATSECLECSAYYGNMTRCSTMLAAYCYTKVCKTYGASAWTEVLCRTKADNAPVVPSDVIAILSSATTAPPVGSDGGVVPSTCAPYTPPSTDTKTTTTTQSSTETKSATDSKTNTETSSKTETVTATQTVSATQSATSTQSNTQSATVATSTGTQTSTGTSPSKPSDDSSGCSVTTGKSAMRALGPLSVILAGLALLVLRRRSRR